MTEAQRSYLHTLAGEAHESLPESMTKAEASENIGYTFGWWKYYTKKKSGSDTVYQGVYITVWKKQKDGTWKYVIDGGNDTPAHPQ